MAKLLMFVYAIIFFFSLFLLSGEAIKGLGCEIDEDCPVESTSPNTLSVVYKCYNSVCIMFREVPLTP
uniref:Nodule-specific cysteine-rich peptide L66 n=1 Tax=Lens culinaris TaxID=3864 RepID=A0A7T8DVG2_LENCU|nr:nodule-specific cysteine-rich peptide L66 [Lens culinaris]